MTSYSKLLPYTCYELGHTWHHSCAKSSFEMLLSSASHSLKLYAVVYLVSAILDSRKKLSKSYIVKFIKDYLRSVTFLSINGSMFVASFCVFRSLFGHINFLSAGFLPGFTSSLLAILAERPSRRGLLAIYVANVASECFWNVLRSRGYVKGIPRGEVILFAASMAIFGYYFKSKYKFSPLINYVLKVIIGKDESGEFSKKKLHTLSSTTKYSSDSYNLCTHVEPCSTHLLKTFGRNFIAGFILQWVFRFLTSFPKVLKKPSVFIDILLHPSNRDAALFVSSFVTLFKAVCCLGRLISKEDKPLHGALAGAISGLSMLFYSSPSLAVYLIWKAIEATYKKGMEAGYLPYVPGGIEFIYSFATAYLFHIAVMENFNMKPSYWRFLSNLTQGRMSEYNRILLEPYGLNSGKNQIWPNYDKKHLSEKFKVKFADKFESF